MMAKANKRSPHGNVVGASHFQPNDQQRPNDLARSSEKVDFRNIIAETAIKSAGDWIAKCAERLSGQANQMSTSR